MPENRKYFRHGDVLLITSRTEEGLPIVPSHNMNYIIWGILAKARDMYRVKVCHFLFMSNHFHMIAVVDNPEDTSSFVGYVKAEIAHAINKLLGRRQKTIWKKGYDSPILLEPTDVEKYVEYIYLNPVTANLVESIDDYPGVSSWRMFSTATYSQVCRKLHRTDIKPLKSPSLSIGEQKEIVDGYKLLSREQCDFVLDPEACLADYSEVIQRIRNKESKLKKIRETSTISATSLRRQSMLKEYASTKHSRRMICLSSNRDYRKLFIDHFRSLCVEARKVYESWKMGDFSKSLPPGLFYPPVRNQCSDVSLII